MAKERHWLPDRWESHDALIGKLAPKLDLSGWINGQVGSEDMKGKIVIVDFWATWCGPCIEAIPHNNEMAKKYADQGVTLIGVCGSGRGEEKMGDVVKPIQQPTQRQPPRMLGGFPIGLHTPWLTEMAH